MAGKEKAIYRYIFGIYSLNENPLINTKAKKEKARKMITRRYLKNFGEKDWQDLLEYEKLQFSCITIKEKMLDYIDPSFENKIEDKINRLLSEYMHEAETTIRKLNTYNEIAFKRFCPEDADDCVKEEAYKEFVETLNEFHPKIEPPSKESWFLHRYRIYDCVMNYRDEIMSEILNKSNEEMFPPEQNVTKAEVDHVIVRMLFKERNAKIKEERGIDLEAIEESLYIIKNYQIFFNEWDMIYPSEEAKSYFTCKKRLENLDFYLD